MSVVWLFFTVSKEETRKAVCSTCKVEVMRGGCRVKSFNTTNLICHLKNHHPEVQKQWQEANAANFSKLGKTKAAAAAAGSPIQQVLDQTKDSAKARSITNKVMEMIALDNQPFSIVEDRGRLQPAKSALLFRPIPPCFERSHGHAYPQTDGLNVTDISFTTDVWSSDVSQMSMLSLTTQWIDENFEMKRAVLHAQEFAGVCSSHTGAAITSAFDCMSAQWKIKK